jgi:hypothetical protein
MTWVNPLALFGLLALVVPILVHLFGRRVAKRQRFPSLRLLQIVTTTPTPKSQPSDILLLLLRCAIVVAAALALAQPRFTTANRRSQERTPARAVIIDTSASMKRLTSDGRPALDRARETGQTVLDSAREGTVVQTGRPGANIAAATSWLETRSGTREIVVISDFQRGAVNDGNLAVVPPGVGIVLRKISTSMRADSVIGDSALIVRVDPNTDDTDVTWRATPPSAAFPLTVLTAPGGDTAARASVAAVADQYPRAMSSHSIAVVFPGYAGTGGLIRQVTSLREPWQGAFLLALHRNRLFRENTGAAGSSSCPPPVGTAQLRNARGSAVAALGAGQPGSPYELVVFSCLQPGTLASTALLAAIVDAAGPDARYDELEPTTLPDELLRQWERPSSDVAPRGVDTSSPDGRWLWLLALLLLGVEQWWRRKSPRRTPEVMIAESTERVA